ncbi:Clavaminate synthase-like protein [Dendrothele bispora CBS 962.96]|uniref:Clavaminate synthase-like protein n=1 Tax=Dendrothele bispora (strain CBS 962.96) TaxID=1314807 RepID=A0A4S8L7S6_DENBC|nr:Clavaminate synthase-like protein [Dendrothele bispora CBS 962.96]
MLLSNRHRTDSTFEEIPIIDLSAVSSTDPVKRRELADLIRDACINVGFFYINNHGIPNDVITAAVEAGKRFFTLPDHVKMDLDIHKTDNFKGYTALLGENTDPNGRGDLHEGFDIGWDSSLIFDTSSALLSDDATAGAAMTGTNVWPPEDVLPGFKEPVLAYYRAAVDLGRSLFPLFALALDLEEDFFKEKITKPAAIMRLLHYPPQKASTVEKDGSVIGIGAHTDYECFTILWQDSVGALQVQNTAGKWIDAVPIPGTLVVNLGDQFARWTNDVFKSTLHRAINKSGVERYSIPLFFGTNYDVLLEPIPSCVSEDMPAKYDVITAGEYVKSRLEATYSHSAL